MRTHHVLGGILVCLCVSWWSLPAAAGDWARFRGPNGAGISDAAGPTEWGPSTNVRWKIALPGPGFSCPIVVGDKVFVTCYSGYGVDRENPGEMDALKRHLVCVNRSDGKILWSKTIDATLPEDPFAPPGVITHGYASHTPASDGERVYVFFGKSGVIAFDMDGNQLWRTSVGTGSDPNRWGSSASPVLYKNLVIVNAGAESHSLVGLDKATGNEVWRFEDDGLASDWGTPILVETRGGTELVIATATEVWGLDPASGARKWTAASASARGMATSLVAAGDTVYSIGGMQGGGSAAVRAGGKGDVTGSNVVWTEAGYSAFGSPVLRDGYLYGANDQGIAFCVNAASGERIYQARLASGEPVTESETPAGQGRGPAAGGARPQGAQAGQGGPRRRSGGGGGGMMGGRSFGSALLVGDKVYFTDISGKTYIFAANTKKFELLGVNEIATDDGSFGATPAVSDGELFLRSNKYLYCVSSH